MFQFPGFASLTYSFSQGSPGFARRGCPIRRSAGKLASSKPRLIAGSYVLHRLSVPRHPPHALTSLIDIKLSDLATLPKKRLTRQASSAISPIKMRDLQITLAFNCQRSSRKFPTAKTVSFVSRTPMVEARGIEPLTSGLQSPRSPS